MMIDLSRRVLRGVQGRTVAGLEGVWAGLATAIAALEPRRRPVLVRRGGAELGPRVAVFCHYDRVGALAPHVRRYLEALIGSGLSVVFVSNAGRLDAASMDWLLPRCHLVMVRRNLGYDFACWRDGMAAAGLPAAGTERLILVNDSVYGPFHPLGPLLARMDPGEADVWSLTDTWQRRYHLQSYFLCFERAALNAPAFRAFWERVADLRSKAAVIRRYEVGLTQALLRDGLRCRALWRYVETVEVLRQGAAAESDEPTAIARLRRQADSRHAAAAARRVALNPTAELWRPLLDQGFPFIKRELLRRNPAGVPDVAAWIDIVRVVAPDMLEEILSDLARGLRNTAP